MDTSSKKLKQKPITDLPHTVLFFVCIQTYSDQLYPLTFNIKIGYLLHLTDKIFKIYYIYTLLSY